MPGDRHEDGSNRCTEDERGVEHHVGQREHPTAVVVLHLLLQDRHGADRDALGRDAEAERDHDELGLAEGEPEPAGDQARRCEHRSDPAGVRHLAGDDRRDHRRGTGAKRRSGHQRREMAESGIGGAGVVEVIPVQQDRHHEQDPVEEPVRARGCERCTRAPAARDMAKAGPQADGHPRDLGADRSGLFPGRQVRTQGGFGHPRRAEASRRVPQRSDQQRDGGA